MSSALRSCLLACAVFFLPLAALAENPRRIPVEWTLPAELTGPDRAVLEPIREALESQLYHLAGLTFEPPPSLFPTEVPLQGIGRLFALDVAGDMRRSAHDDQDPPQRRQLTPADWRRIFQSGTITVPSRAYPGRSYVFRINPWIIRGTDRLRVNVTRAHNSAIWSVRVGIPECYLDEAVNPVASVRSFGQGIANALTQIVGLIDREPAFTAEQAEVEVRRIHAEDLVAQFRSLAGGNALGFVPETRLYDIPLMDTVQTRLVLLEQEANEGGPAREQRIRQEVEAAHGARTPTEREQMVVDRVAEARQERFYELIAADPELETIAPGLRPALIAHGRARQLIATGERQIAERLDAHRATTAERLRAENPVASRVQEWVDIRVNNSVNAYYRENRFGWYQAIATSLRENGYLQDAFILQSTTSYLEQNATALLRDLARQRRAARRHLHEFERWSVRAGHVQRDPRTGLYSASPVARVAVPTAFPGWRIANALVDTAAILWEGARYKTVEQFWNGPLGWHRWDLTRDSFFAQHQVNAQTGEIVPVPASQTTTVRGNISRLWQYVAGRRAEFERGEEDAFGNRLVPRMWFYFANEMVRGWGGSAAIPIVQGIGSLFVTATTALTWTTAVSFAPVTQAVSYATGWDLGIINYANYVGWGTLGGVGRYLWSTLLYDFNRPRSTDAAWFPLAQSLLWQTGLRGAGGLVAFGAVVPAALLGWAGAFPLVTYGYVGARWLVDHSLGWGLLRLMRANVPLAAVPRIISVQSGPGVSQDYFYGIQPDLAMAAVLAQLEMIQLTDYRAQVTTIASQPREDMNAAVTRLRDLMHRAGLTLNIPTDVEPFTTVTTSVQAHLDEIASVVGARVTRIAPLVNLARTAHRPIRMTGAQLEAFVPRVASVVQQFYTQRLPHLINDAFWNGMRLTQNDWTGVARRLITTALGQEFLTPVETTDASMRVEVTASDVENLIDSILDRGGIRPRETVTISAAAIAAERPRVTPTYASIGAHQLCANYVAEAGAGLMQRGASYVSP